MTEGPRHMETNSLEGKSAFDLFPDLVRYAPRKKRPSHLVPQPPDISWLTNGMAEEDPGQPDDSLTALVVIAADGKRTFVEETLGKMGYAIDTALSAAHAIERLQAVHYNLIICRTEAALKYIHKYICNLPPIRRREMYYAIVGPNLHTLYNLEALSLSANLVINDQDLQYLEKILYIGFRDYENLFRPLLDTLRFGPSFR